MLLSSCELELLNKKYEDFELQILSINDLHGFIVQDEYGLNGISNLSYKINSIREENDVDDVLLLANGDMFQGTAVSNMTKGKLVIDCMNMIEFDMMGIGNHEFDWGIEEILKYFDGDIGNGEADFPLLNANIYNKADNTLLAIDNGNVCEYKIVDKNGLKVCLISYGGDYGSSIESSKIEDYRIDTDITNSVNNICKALKEQGLCDVVVVNVHYGSGNKNVEDYYINKELARLKCANGAYVVDAVINGHTHQPYYGIIERDGVGMPVVQAASYNEYLGNISLSIDMETKEVYASNVKLIDISNETNYDYELESYLDLAISDLELTNLCCAGETVYYKSSLQNWIGSVGLSITGADVYVSNTGGIRTNGNITRGEYVNVADVWEISPFDNNIMLVEVEYSKIKTLLSSNSVYYSSKVPLQYGQIYTFAIDNYVYGFSQMDNVRSDKDIDTGLIIRDYLIEDLSIRGNMNIDFNPISDYSAVVGLKYNK